jgi:hypothetical protein
VIKDWDKAHHHECQQIDGQSMSTKANQIFNDKVDTALLTFAEGHGDLVRKNSPVIYLETLFSHVAVPFHTRVARWYIFKPNIPIWVNF